MMMKELNSTGSGTDSQPNRRNRTTQERSLQSERDRNEKRMSLSTKRIIIPNWNIAMKTSSMDGGERIDERL